MDQDHDLFGFSGSCFCLMCYALVLKEEILEDVKSWHNHQLMLHQT